MSDYYIDTHAHIYDEKFGAELPDAIERAIEKNVLKIYMPNIDSTTIDSMLEVEHQYPENCIATMGLHPCSVKKNFEKELYQIEAWLNKRKFVAIGEIGLDLYWDTSTLSYQEEALKIQIGWAIKNKLPVILHNRDAHTEILSLLDHFEGQQIKGVFHCFSGTLEQAKSIIKKGFYLGIGGVSTFKNTHLAEVLPAIDLEHMVLETDSPYLAPAPHRGKRNEPSYIPLIAEKIADHKKIPSSEVMKITTQNALKLFQSDNSL